MILEYGIHVRSHDGSREAVCRFPTLLSSSIFLGERKRRCEFHCEEKPGNITCRELSKHTGVDTDTSGPGIAMSASLDVFALHVFRGRQHVHVRDYFIGP
jgi:hypothetical protein